MKRTAIIMAGGSGERFWPLSRTKRPKQLLNLLSDQTMLEESIKRVDGIIDNKDVFIITSEVLLEPIRNSLPNLPKENVIAEPYKRNTAPCLALAAGFIAAKYQNEYKPSEISVSVLTADQDISPVSGFKNTVEQILKFVEQKEAICTIGITPTRPETGYGYVEIEEKFHTPEITEIKKVKAFREKPNRQTAEEYHKSGLHFWNSGMFFFRLDTFIAGMQKELPEVGSKIMDIAKEYSGNTETAFEKAFANIAPIFEKFPDISIDYGLMEKYSNIYTASAQFKWDDVGAWDAIDRVKEKNSEGNIIEGSEALIDCSNTVLINKSAKNITVGAIGLEDFVIVVTDDAVLISPKDRVQDVKKCVQKLRQDNKLELL